MNATLIKSKGLEQTRYERNESSPFAWVNKKYNKKQKQN